MRKLSLKELGRKTLDQFKGGDKNDIVLVLDNIRSGMNVGSFFRTADAFALKKIVLCGITARPPHKEINKTAIGADQSMEWEYAEDITEKINVLKAAGYMIIGVEQTDESIMLENFSPVPDEKYALIFGNEVNGLSDEILPFLDQCLEIPQFGTKHSLNVSVSGGIVIWHLLLQKLKKA
jgi:23S rRNA (guanosine2251-2'-O)-methyltransferase